MGHKTVCFLEAAITRVKFYSLLSSNEANKSSKKIEKVPRGDGFVKTFRIAVGQW